MHARILYIHVHEYHTNGVMGGGNGDVHMHMQFWTGHAYGTIDYTSTYGTTYLRAAQLEQAAIDGGCCFPMQLL